MKWSRWFMLFVLLIGLLTVSCAEIIDAKARGRSQPTKIPGPITNTTQVIRSLSDYNICTSPEAVGRTGIRLLSRSAYLNTLRELVGQAAVDSAANDLLLIPDNTYRGFEFDTAGTEVSDTLIGGYFKTAKSIASYLVANPARLSVMDTCATATAITSACVTTSINKFGTRAFRRPLSTQEVAAFQAVYQREVGVSQANAMKALISAFLTSPHFAYLMENGGNVIADSYGKFSVSNYELASRLSYFLWNSMPDAQLLAKASSGTLIEGGVLESEINRLMNDPRGTDSVLRFLGAWFEVSAMPPSNQSPAFAKGIVLTSLRANAIKEANDFLNYVIKSDGNFAALISSTKAFVSTKDVADVYGVQPAGEVSLDPMRRGGILTRIAKLAGGSDQHSLVHRGLKVREQVLCETLGRPSPEFLAQGTKELAALPDSLSHRERIDRVTNKSQCLTCHGQINPPAFAFENFDALGRYRTIEEHYNNGVLTSENTVDAKVAFSIGAEGTIEADGGAALSAALARSPQANMCVARKMFRYALGRSEVASDNCHLQAVFNSMIASGGSLKKGLVTLLKSRYFHFNQLSP